MFEIFFSCTSNEHIAFALGLGKVLAELNLGIFLASSSFCCFFAWKRLLASERSEMFLKLFSNLYRGFSLLKRKKFQRTAFFIVFILHQCHREHFVRRNVQPRSVPKWSECAIRRECVSLPSSRTYETFSLMIFNDDGVGALMTNIKIINLSTNPAENSAKGRTRCHRMTGSRSDGVMFGMRNDI